MFRTAGTTDREKWVEWTENKLANDPTVDMYDVIDEYGMSTDRYDEIVEEAGV